MNSLRGTWRSVSCWRRLWTGGRWKSITLPSQSPPLEQISLFIEMSMRNCCFSADSFHVLSSSYLLFMYDSPDDDSPDTFLSLSDDTFSPYSFVLCFFSLKILAGMNVHPAEFDGLKQEYNVKGYPTFCYFEWVEPSHQSHLRRSTRFQGSEHQRKATSNRKNAASASSHDGGRLAACTRGFGRCS